MIENHNIIRLQEMLESLMIRQDSFQREIGELRDEIARLRAQGRHREEAAALMEAHQRMAWAAACFTFTMIGIPLGLKTSRRETSVGIAVSLGLAMVFYFFVVLANALKARPLLHPEAILWFPNLLFELLGLWMLWRVARK